MSCFIYLISSLTLYDKQKRSERLFILAALNFIVETTTSRRNQNVFHFHLDPQPLQWTRRSQVSNHRISCQQQHLIRSLMHRFTVSGDRAIDSWGYDQVCILLKSIEPHPGAALSKLKDFIKIERFAIKFIIGTLDQDGCLSISWFKSEKTSAGILPSNLRVFVEWNWD